VTSTDTSVTFAANATLTAVATAVNALGNGWSAEAVSGYGSWASADLRALQGALHARSAPAELVIHTEDLAGFDVDAARGWLVRRGGVSGWPWGEPAAAWTEGRGNYRVVYDAGYATVPEDVQEACAEWVAVLFFQTKRDPELVVSKTEGVGTVISALNRHAIPPHILALLAPYRRIPIG
jgi:hypothetical protein